MTRKDFELIADVLARINPITDIPKAYKRELIGHFADELAKTNYRFNRDKFINAAWRNKYES